jgi:hypothetical protein
VYQSGALIAATMLATVLEAKAAFAAFCGDVQAALAQSANFANLRGAATDERTWTSSTVITGASICYISRADNGKYNLDCAMKTTSRETEANEAFSSLMTQVKSCLSPPKYSYRTKELNSSANASTTSSTNFIIDSNHKTLAHLSLVRVGDFLSLESPIYDPNTGKQIGTWRTGFHYGVGLVVLGR